MTASRVASADPSNPSGLMANVFNESPPASFVSNSASLRLPAPKSTVKNDLIFSIAVTGLHDRAATRAPSLIF